MGSLGGALGQIGTTLGDQTGLSNISGGLQSLFGGGDEAAAPGPDFVGPPSPYQAPSFLQGLYQGFTGGLANPSGGADVPSPGGQIGGGVGELLAFLERIKQGGGQAALGPIVNAAMGQRPAGVQMLPGYHAAQAPSGGLIHNLIGAATYGILGGSIPSGGNV